MTLEESRNEIDRIDKGIFSLFEERMKVAENIVKIKIEKNLPILNSSREDEVLEKVGKSVSPEYSRYARELSAFMMKLSKERQKEIHSLLVKTPDTYSKELIESRKEIDMPIVAVQGVRGSYASIAAKKMYKNCELKYVDSFGDVMKAINNGDCNYGVLPVENSTAGSVIDVYDLLISYKFNIVKALRLPISHCLLGVEGTTPKTIKEVYTHPHAFPQCKPFFKENSGIKQVTCKNTAVAAKTVYEMNDISKAAIASEECAKLYNLDIIAKNIQQTDENCTRFVSVSKQPEIHSNADKISLIISLPHKIGSLYNFLSSFSLCGLSLTKIESRPDPKTPFEYIFYVDFLGNLKSQKTLNLLSSLHVELPLMYFLGNYNENE